MGTRYKHRVSAALISLLAASSCWSTVRTSAGVGASYSTQAGSSEYDCSLGSNSTASCNVTKYFTDEGFTTPVLALNYSASGEASFGTLKTSARISTQNNVDTEATPIEEFTFIGNSIDEASVFGQASFSDHWMIRGKPTGTAGTLRLSYMMDGASESPHFNGLSVSSSTSIWIRELKNTTLAGGTVLTSVKASGTNFNSPFNGSIAQVVSLELPFVFGEDLWVSVLMTSHAGFMLFGMPMPDLLTQTDFSHTATVLGITVLDAGGNKVPFELDAASNAQVFEQFSSPVPEPETMTLAAIGLACLLLCPKALRTRKPRTYQ